MKFTSDYDSNVALFDSLVSPNASFDIIKRSFTFAGARETFYTIDGFTNSGEGAKMLAALSSLPSLGSNEELISRLPVTEAECVDDADDAAKFLLSGCSVLFAEGTDAAVVIDLRSYPARDATEPENDRVLRGSRDGFVETLLFNTAMIRRRIRDTSLRVEYACAGRSTKTDIALCYIEERVDRVLLDRIRSSLSSLDTDSITLGHESLAECLIKKRWYDPFPKIRLTERPDVAASSVLEGSVVVICDNSPEALLFPTSVFDFLQEADDFYFPPLTGTYLRVIRHAVFLLSIILVPLWYLAVMNADVLPDFLSFAVPDDPGEIPIIIQLFLVEFALDGLKLAYLNTPNTLSGSVSVVGGLLLGDFAVKVGWLSPDVILYMAFASVANYTQSSYELGYAFKYIRMITLALTALFGVWGFAAGLAFGVVLAALNKTFAGRSYLYPLIPFDATALRRLFLRPRKFD